MADLRAADLLTTDLRATVVGSIYCGWGIDNCYCLQVDYYCCSCQGLTAVAATSGILTAAAAAAIRVLDTPTVANWASTVMAAC